MNEALTHSYKNYAWTISCIIHAVFLILLLTSFLRTLSFVASRTPDTAVDDQSNSQVIPLIEYEEPPVSQAQTGTSIQPASPSQESPSYQSEPIIAPQIMPDSLTEPESIKPIETENKNITTKRPPRKAKAAWIKQPKAQPQPAQQSNTASTGQQLAQQFNSYMQQQKRPPVRGTSPSYDLALEAYGRRILTAICDASRVYEKSVVIHQKINENIRCTVTINKQGKILKVSLDPKTGNSDMDKAIEGLCKVSAIPKIPDNLATNTFDFTVYFRLGKTQNGINKVRFVPNAL